MNKKFYFALALTAGLFASCSSDDLTAEAPQQQGIEVNDNEPAQIKISTGMATRGTGSVGFPTAQWDGQKFNLFMFQKGTFAPATYRATETDPETPIYLNTEMTTDPLTQTANYVLGGDIQYNYFPGNGAYSFWAYRIDDALDPAPAALPAQPFVYVDDTNAEVAFDAPTASKVVVPIDIDGSQDIMVAIADTVAALTQLNTKLDAQGKQATTQDRIYTAYSARREVNPQLSFQHLLTRLSFRVIADSRDVSNKADWLTADPATAGEEFRGFKITQVRVKTKSKGHVVAAFKDLSRVAEPRLVWDDGQDWALEADGSEPSTLKSVFLQTRDVNIDPARIEMKGYNSMAAAGTVVNCSAGYSFDGADHITIGDDVLCYIDNSLDAQTGMPTGVAKKLSEYKAAGVTVYFATYENGTRADGSTYDNYAETTDKSAPLRPFNLANDGTGDDLIPHWEGYVAPQPAALAWHPWAYQITGYTWTETTDPADIGVAVDAAAAPTIETVGALNAVLHYQDGMGFDHYYKLTAIQDNCPNAQAYADQTSDPVTDHVDGVAGDTDGDIVYVLADPADLTSAKTYYKFYAEGAAGVGGNAVPTSIGEALLVAPADANGYFVEFTYKRYKRITDTHVEPITNTATIQVTSGQGFEAGKHYVITARLFKDGNIVIGGGGDSIKPVDWGNGGGAGAGGTDQDEWDLE